MIDEGLDNYAAVFVPGGQAPVVDIMQNAEAGEIFRHFHERGKPTAMLCHGPMASVAAMPNAKAFPWRRADRRRQRCGGRSRQGLARKVATG